MDKWQGRLGSLASVRQPVEVKENSEFKPVVVHYILPVAKGLGWYI